MGYGCSTEVQGFTDADWGMCRDTFKSSGGYVFTMAGAAISWQSKRQHNVSLSSTEAEYKSLKLGAQEAIWLWRLLLEVLPNDGQIIHLRCKDVQITRQLPDSPLIMHCDNQYSIKLAKNPVMHSRTKHIGIQHHYIRELIEDGHVSVKHISTNQQPADILTKALPRVKFVKHKMDLGVKSLLQLPLREHGLH
jgi:hypothetical protein